MFSFLLVSLATAGVFPGWTPGVEGQQGAIPVAFSPDGTHLALTGWDKAGLLDLDLDSGAQVQVSQWRGAGFHPVWTRDGLLFKEVLPAEAPPAGEALRPGEGGGNAALHRIVRWQGQRQVLDEGPRLGDVSATPAGRWGWTRDLELRLGPPQQIEERHALGTWVNLTAVHPAGMLVALNDHDGRMGILHTGTGAVRWLSEPGCSHPAWSDDGSLLLYRLPGGAFAVVETASGLVRWTANGRHPRWVPGKHQVVFDRPITDAQWVLSAELYLVDLDAGDTVQLTHSSLNERYPLPTPSGDGLAFTDTRDGAVYLAPLLGSMLGAPVRVFAGPVLVGESPPPPPHDIPALEMPYMHQLWDTPDEFPGYWSCGPTSCVQTAQKYQLLPDWDHTSSWPYEHVSHWGAYIPYEYTFNGYTYDTWGVTYGDYWCQGAHGFICREYGGAVGEYLIDWLDQHGMDGFWGGTAFSTLTAEVDAAYPTVTLANVLDSGHLIVTKGYADDHTILVNDPYGNANGDWGEYDGEGAVYDWQGYNNGHLEIEVTYIFGSEGDLDLRWDAELLQVDAPDSLLSGQLGTVVLTFLNTGSETWRPDDIVLGSALPQDRVSPFEDAGSWPAWNRPAAVEAVTPPGGEGRFVFTLLAPEVQRKTEYAESFQLRMEDHCWFGPDPEDLTLDLEVLPASANQPPVAVAEAPPQVRVGRAVSLDGSGSSDPDGSITQWAWQMPGEVLEGEAVYWTPARTGVVQVTLTVTDDLGATASDQVEVEVVDLGDGPRWSGESGGCACQALDRRAAPPLGLFALLALVAEGRRRRREPRC